MCKTNVINPFQTRLTSELPTNIKLNTYTDVSSLSFVRTMPYFVMKVVSHGINKLVITLGIFFTIFLMTIHMFQFVLYMSQCNRVLAYEYKYKSVD